MDDNRVEEEVSSCGIFKQSIKVISQWKLIFFQITLALIVPLSLTILLRAHISKYLIDSYMSVESFLFEPATNTTTTTTYYTATQVNNPNDRLMDKLSIYFEIGYFTFLIIFSLLSTSAIVYTIACIYSSAKEITFRKVISVVPKTVVFAGLSIGYQVLIMNDDLNFGVKIIIGELCFDMLVIGFLLVLVIQTVIYFVCKSYHHEIVDKTCLADHLEATYGGYVQLNGPKELQLQSL
ncbi:hypothetical protein ACFE04_016749 [Oxalis oulophora]